MTTLPEDESPESHSTLDQARDQLRNRTLARAIQIAPRVLDRALAVRRPSFPVRALGPWDHMLVADHVLVMAILQRMDKELPAVSVHTIDLSTNRHHDLRAIAITIAAPYGHALREVGDRTRRTAERVVLDVLGQPVAPNSAAPVRVHIAALTDPDPT